MKSLTRERRTDSSPADIFKVQQHALLQRVKRTSLQVASGDSVVMCTCGIWPCPGVEKWKYDDDDDAAVMNLMRGQRFCLRACSITEWGCTVGQDNRTYYYSKADVNVLTRSGVRRDQRVIFIHVTWRFLSRAVISTRLSLFGTLLLDPPFRP